MYGVILAGGSGTRFWPLSREAYPKQLLKIFDDQTLIQATLSRITSLIPANQIYIVTNLQQKEQIRFQIAPNLGVHFITEPAGRNTAVAIGLAAVALSKEDPDGVMAVLSADHFIQNKQAFTDLLLLGKTVAQKGYLVTIGEKPTCPETAYGYIQRGKPLTSCSGAFSVQRFIEKPNLLSAEAFLKSTDFLWNTGIFIWKTSVILESLGRFMPELLRGLLKIDKERGTACEKTVLEEVYAKLPSISIDYGVLEKSDRLAVIPAAMGWKDVGSWSALDEVVPGDDDGNIIKGNVVNVGCKNSIVYAHKRVVAAVGLTDMVVVDTEDSTLICPKTEAQEVKRVVEILKDRGEESYRVHRTVIRPWGAYTVLEEGDGGTGLEEGDGGTGYKIKRITVNPKSRLSLQMHQKRSEHWVVISGTARVTCGESIYTLGSNQSTFIPMGVKHRLENPGDETLQIIEVQSGGYLGEDDITRFSDDFDRTP